MKYPPGMRRCLVVCLLLAGCGGGGAASSTTVGYDAGEVALLAYDVCQQAVEMRLRSPGSAVWPPIGEVSVVQRTGARFRVAGFVDSENGFGALLRSDVVCVLERVDVNEWRPLSVRVIGQ